MILREATKGQMMVNGIDKDVLPETAMVLSDTYGNLHIFNVDPCKVVWNDDVDPSGFDLEEEEPKMSAYFGDKGAVKNVDLSMTTTFYRNHGAKSPAVQAALARALAETESKSHRAFRLGRALKGENPENYDVYMPFFFRAYRLIMEGK